MKMDGLTLLEDYISSTVHYLTALVFWTVLTDSLADVLAHVFKSSHGGFLVLRGIAGLTDRAFNLARV